MDSRVLYQLSFVTLLPLVVTSCCIPNQWEGQQEVSYVTNKNGQASIVKALFNVSFDATAKKLFLIGSSKVSGQKTYKEMILQDYNTGYQYTVVDGYCTKTNMTTPFPRTCLTEQAEKLLTTFIGSREQNVEVEVYHDEPTSSDVTLIKGSCIPVSAYRELSDSLTYVNYYGVVPGISNTTVFNIPKQCQRFTKTLNQARRGFFHF